MRFFPRSIRGRLLVAGIFFTGIALIVASLSIGEVLDRFARRGLDDRLDAQIALLLRSVRPDGTVDGAMLQEIGPFTQHRRGWGWRIDAPGRSYASEDVVPLDAIRREGRPGREGRFREHPERLQSGQTGEVYVRTFEKQTRGGPVRIIAAAPRWVFHRLRQAAVLPVLAALAGLSLALLVTTILQLHIGLKPLGRLKAALADVRSGALSRIPSNQPSELAPVVAELNGLLDENEAALARARAHVSNLAHSLKTPLATLSIRLNELDRSPGRQQLGELVAQIDGAIRHHLARARAASPGAPGQPQISIATAIREVVQALGRIYADKKVAIETSISPDLMVKCDPRDLTEMLGNLLDNACKWATGHILLTASEDGKNARIEIDDDGPGLSQEAIDQALVPGRRLDEREDGHGFGLPIARELAELHGGALELGDSPLGGLRAALVLPR
jgi:signal transduction histidine kinase